MGKTLKTSKSENFKFSCYAKNMNFCASHKALNFWRFCVLHHPEHVVNHRNAMVQYLNGFLHHQNVKKQHSLKAPKFSWKSFDFFIFHRKIPIFAGILQNQSNASVGAFTSLVTSYSLRTSKRF